MSFSYARVLLSAGVSMGFPSSGCQKGVEFKGVAFVMVLVVLTILAALENTLSPCPPCACPTQGNREATVTVLAVSTLMAVSVVTANPLKLNPPFSDILSWGSIAGAPCISWTQTPGIDLFSWEMQYKLKPNKPQTQKREKLTSRLLTSEPKTLLSLLFHFLPPFFPSPFPLLFSFLPPFSPSFPPFIPTSPLSPPSFRPSFPPSFFPSFRPSFRPSFPPSFPASGRVAWMLANIDQ